MGSYQNIRIARTAICNLILGKIPVEITPILLVATTCSCIVHFFMLKFHISLLLLQEARPLKFTATCEQLPPEQWNVSKDFNCVIVRELVNSFSCDVCWSEHLAMAPLSYAV